MQNWECACPYPSFYPMDTTIDSSSSGACKRSSQLCRGGTWTYPCKRPLVCAEDNPSDCKIDIHTCVSLTPDERDALVGADVGVYGQCECAPGDRISMDGSTGLPVCVPDTCAATPRCNEAEGKTCPGNAQCVDGMCTRATSSCSINEDCGPSGICEADGTCTWGRWVTLPIEPYVFGECECPDGCHSVGSLCACY